MKKITFLLLLCSFALAANAQVFVKPASDGGSDSNDGSTWNKAMATMAKAIPIAKAATVKEIWVKKGTYTDVWGDKLNDGNIGGVSIYGGFAGTEVAIADRIKGSSPWSYTNETIITFSIKNSLTFNNTVKPENPCLIEGFSFKNFTGEGSMGARNNVIFKNCIWANNSVTKVTILTAYVTGNNGPLRLLDCLFENNTVSGGNIVQFNPSAVGAALADKCVFIGNTSATHQILAMGSNSYATNCIFYNNEAKGSIVQGGNATAEIVNCLVFNNKSEANVVNVGNLLINSTIANNQSKGGVTLTATAKVYNTILNGNITDTNEPISFVGDVAAEVKNCAFFGALPAKVVEANNLEYANNDFSAFTKASVFAGLNKEKTAELAATDWTLTNKPHGLINGGDKTFFDLATFGKDPMNDLAGAARVQNEKIDLGAYENANVAPTLPILTVTAATGGNTVTTDKNGAHRMGECIILSATQASGNQFKDWTDNAGKVVSTTPDFTYSMPETSVTLTANFEKATTKYTLTVTAGANGSVSAGGMYFPGEKIQLTATANEGYLFAAWTNSKGEVISKENPYTLTMEKKDTAVVASFKYHLTRYLISPNAPAGEEPMLWGRTAKAGETIINLNKVMVNGVEKAIGLDQFFKGNYWPVALGAGDEIWLLGGQFQTLETIQITEPGVLIYGGFAGTENSPAERTLYDFDENGINESWEFENQTVLAGQMITKEVNQSVLRLSADDIVADGLVVEGGRQSAGIDYGVGVDLGLRNAGIRGAIMRNSIIRKNLVTAGGKSSVYVCGVYITGNSTLESCLVENNFMDSSNEGPSYASGINAGPGTKILNCVIRNNRNEGKDNPGGGNCHGGGVKLGGEMTNCLVYNNTAVRGAGIYATAAPTTMINYCTIVNNKVSSYNEDSKKSVSGGGVYFRGIQGTDKGGTLLNSIVWNNTCTDGVVGGENIYIQGGGGDADPQKGKAVILGANAYNAGSLVKAEDGTPFYTASRDNEKSIENLPMENIFVKPGKVVGYNPSDMAWPYDWRPTYAGLNIAVPQAENEKDILGSIRPLSGGAIGAYQYGSSTGFIPNYKSTFSPFVYCSEGKLRVNNSEPVAVEVYTTTGMKVAEAAATTHDHEFTLAKGQIYIVVVKCGNLKYSTKVGVN